MAVFAEFRPALAGPAAESPSTMMSSESGPWVRQSANLSGMPVEPMLAALRRVSSICLDVTRLITALVNLSRTALMWVLGPPPLNQSVRPPLTTS